MSEDDFCSNRSNENKLSELVQRINFENKNLKDEESSVIDGDTIKIDNDTTIKRSNRIQFGTSNKHTIDEDSSREDSTIGSVSFHTSSAMTGAPFFSMDETTGKKEVDILSTSIPLIKASEGESEYLGKQMDDSVEKNDDDVERSLKFVHASILDDLTNTVHELLRNENNGCKTLLLFA